MYHSPGLRDGVSTQGCECAQPDPQPLEQNQKVLGFTLTGNKFGWPQVFPVSWGCGKTPFRRDLKTARALFEISAGTPSKV